MEDNFMDEKNILVPIVEAIQKDNSNISVNTAREALLQVLNDSAMQVFLRRIVFLVISRRNPEVSEIIKSILG